MSWWRRTRAITVVAGTWGTAWAAFGGMLGILTCLRPPGNGIPNAAAPLWTNLGAIIQQAARMGEYGAVSGLLFAILLLTFERRGGLHTVSRPRTLGWGVLAGVGWIGVDVIVEFMRSGHILSDVPAALATLAFLAGASAYATIRLAQRTAVADEAVRG